MCPSQDLAAQVTRRLVNALSHVGRVSYAPSWSWLLGFQTPHEGTVPGVLCVSSGEVISVCDTPSQCELSGSQEAGVSNWQPSHSVVEDVVSGDKSTVTPCLPALAVTHLLLCFQGWRALNSIWLVLLCYMLGCNPLFCVSGVIMRH